MKTHTHTVESPHGRSLTHPDIRVHVGNRICRRVPRACGLSLNGAADDLHRKACLPRPPAALSGRKKVRKPTLNGEPALNAALPEFLDQLNRCTATHIHRTQKCAVP